MIITNATRPSRRKVYFLSHYITTSSRAKLAFTLPSVKEKSGPFVNWEQLLIFVNASPVAFSWASLWVSADVVF